MEKALNYIDIFAGCGGLSTGLFNAGWHGLFAVEKNADAFSTLKFNLIDTVPHFVWPEWLSFLMCCGLKITLDGIDCRNPHWNQLYLSIVCSAISHQRGVRPLILKN